MLNKRKFGKKEARKGKKNVSPVHQSNIFPVSFLCLEFKKKQKEILMENLFFFCLTKSEFMVS